MFKKLKIDKLSPKHQNSFLDTLLRENKSIKEFYASNINDWLKLSELLTLFIEYDKKDDLEKYYKNSKNWRFFSMEGLQYSPLTEFEDGVWLNDKATGFDPVMRSSILLQPNKYDNEQ